MILKSIKAVIILLIGMFFIACNDSNKNTVYQCPMECQTDTCYTTAGKCPVCEMELKPTEKLKTSVVINSKIK